jgi:hypothetical protein
VAGIAQKTGSASAGLRLLSLLAALAPSPAAAGAWVAPEGGQNISTQFTGLKDEALYSETTYYWEAPMGDDLSFVAAPWAGLDPETRTFGDVRWEVTLGGKLATHRGARAVTAFQAGVVWNSDPIADCAEGQVELRWLGGRSIGDRSFANVEAAERAGEGGCGGERLDVTLGHRFNETWLGLGQVFIDDPRLGDSSVKLQMSLVRFSAAGEGLQFGIRTRVDGEELEPALVIGFWGGPSH